MDSIKVASAIRARVVLILYAPNALSRPGRVSISVIEAQRCANRYRGRQAQSACTCGLRAVHSRVRKWPFAALGEVQRYVRYRGADPKWLAHAHTGAIEPDEIRLHTLSVPKLTASKLFRCANFQFGRGLCPDLGTNNLLQRRFQMPVVVAVHHLKNFDEWI